MVVNGRAQGRFASAFRTLGEVYRRQLRYGLRRRARLRGPGQDVTLGYLEKLQLNHGQIHVIGWTSASEITVETELQSIRIRPSLARPDTPSHLSARGFDERLSGSRTVTIIADGAPVLRRRLDTLPRRLAAILRAAMRAGSTAAMPGALAAYFLRGDGTAGSALEARLLPVPEAMHAPIASAGLFGSDNAAEPDDPVDIVVPIYDAFDETRRCLVRLEANTAPHHRVILIDDASTDARMAPLLRQFAESRPGTLVLSQSANEGFISAVNKGLDAASGHVVLLNTDAFVPQGWLPRLLAPILADPSVASVTPLSNNAEIAGAPVLSAEWDAMPGTADLADQAVRDLNPEGSHVNSPTGVGFCMAMARDWLERVPSFDPAFGRGYGEEVDWCRKVAGQGGRHVLAGTLFVEHSGGRSFGPEKLGRIQENNAIISARHAGYATQVSAFKQADPLIGPRLVAGLALTGAQGPMPIYLAHRQGGGATLWLEAEIASQVSDDRSVLVLKDGDVAGHILLELHTPLGVTRGNVPEEDLDRYLGVLPCRELVYSCLVSARDPLRLAELAVTSLKPADRFRVLFHDYLPLCPSYNLMSIDGLHCGLPEGVACQSCFARLSGLSGRRPDTITEWRDGWKAVMDRADAIEVFSNDSRSIVLRVWPDLAEKIQVVPHEAGWLPERVEPPSGKTRIGVLGAIGYNKGAGVVQDLAALGDARCQIVVIGRIDPAYRHSAVKVHGSYARGEVADLARQYNVACWLVPSIWPETFSFVTQECLATGLPVFTFDLGAQADAARSAPNGRVISRDLSPREILDCILAG